MASLYLNRRRDENIGEKVYNTKAEGRGKKEEAISLG
jgi:hypothetical protein